MASLKRVRLLAVAKSTYLHLLSWKRSRRGWTMNWLWSWRHSSSGRRQRGQWHRAGYWEEPEVELLGITAGTQHPPLQTSSRNWRRDVTYRDSVTAGSCLSSSTYRKYRMRPFMLNLWTDSNDWDQVFGKGLKTDDQINFSHVVL